MHRSTTRTPALLEGRGVDADGVAELLCVAGRHKGVRNHLLLFKTLAFRTFGDFGPFPDHALLDATSLKT